MIRAASGMPMALLALSLLGAVAGPLVAQPQLTVSGPPATGPLRHLTPRFEIVATGFSESDPALSIRLQIATRSDFEGALLLDTTIAPTGPSVQLRRPLPQDSSLYWRASALTASGAEVRSPVTGPRQTVDWVTLVFPNDPNGTAVAGRQPVLAWSAATVDSPPGPWRFDVVVTNAATRQVVAAQTVADTVFVPPIPLEANTPYRWTVTGRLGVSDSVVVASRATFVIVATDAPLTTLLYQTFPNPFPTPSAQVACIWFDLHQPASVSLEIFDLRGALVRRLVPSTGLGPLFPAGRYGRGSWQNDAGCDMRMAWDGRGEDGRNVPAGVYLVRMRTGEREMVKKIVFRGR